MTKCNIYLDCIAQAEEGEREGKQNREEGGVRERDEKREIKGMKRNDCGFAGGLDATAASARETRRWLYAFGT